MSIFDVHKPKNWLIKPIIITECRRSNLDNTQITSFNLFPNKPWSLRVCSKSLLKTLWEKEKLLITSNFSFSQWLLPVWKTFCHFHQTWNCRLQTISVWKSLKFVIWERVNMPEERIYLTWKHDKGEDAGNHHFLLFPQYFLPIIDRFNLLS